MRRMIAIDKLYMNKMPKSCKECPLTYLDSGDDAYFGANERRCVIDDSCIDGMVSERAYDCPLVEAIPKADYENRLKADMVATLEDLKQDIIAEAYGIETDCSDYVVNVADIDMVIQQKINALKENEDGRN